MGFEPQDEGPADSAHRQSHFGPSHSAQANQDCAQHRCKLHGVACTCVCVCVCVCACVCVHVCVCVFLIISYFFYNMEGLLDPGEILGVPMNT